VNNDSFGRTPDEVEDEARHGYAVGTVVLRAIADKVSEIALSRWEREHLHKKHFYLYELLGTHTVFGLGDEPVTDGSPKAVWAYWDTYSDGTPVSIVVGPPSSRGWSAHGNVHNSGIPSLPNTTGNDSYNGFAHSSRMRSDGCGSSASAEVESAVRLRAGGLGL
jgi:hypothetical protein